MQQLFATPSLELVLIVARGAALLIGLLIFAWAFRHWRRAAIRDTQRVFEQLDLVRSELLIMREAIHHSGTHAAQGSERSAPANARSADRAPRTASFERPIAGHTGAFAPLPAASSAAKGYEFAARMARNGATKEELIRNCGVTSHEAELLVKLHGFRADKAAEVIGRKARVVEGHDAQAASRTVDVLGHKEAAGRQTVAATPGKTAGHETQRTQSVQAAQQRSRLVAVG